MSEFKTEREAIELLRKHVRDGDGEFLFRGVHNAPGTDGTRIADALSIGMWPSRGHDVSFYEVKCSRADWLQELNNPAKADAFFPFVNYVWLVVPDKSIIKKDELPKGWGIISCSGDGLRKTTKAIRKDAKPLPVELLVTICRAERRRVSDLIRDSQATDRLEKEYSRGFRAGKKSSGDARQIQQLGKKVESLKKSIAAFEDASGLQIANAYTSEFVAADLGKKVAAIQRGGIEQLHRCLPNIEHAIKSIQSGVDAIKALEM